MENIIEKREEVNERVVSRETSSAKVYRLHQSKSRGAAVRQYMKGQGIEKGQDMPLALFPLLNGHSKCHQVPLLHPVFANNAKLDLFL